MSLDIEINDLKRQLVSLHNRLDEMERSQLILSEMLRESEKRAAAQSKTVAQPAPARGRTSNARRVADDGDLDSEYGDPRIKYGLKEKYWNDQPDPYIGYAFSECSPEYLDAQAKYLDACAYMKRKDGDERSAGFKERDAARARGWAIRIRERGAQATPSGVDYGDSASSGSSTDYELSNEEIPF